MHPILWTLKLSPYETRIAGVLASIFLTLVILADAKKSTGAARRSMLLQAAAFLVVALGASLLLLTPDRLPDPAVIEIRSWGVMSVLGMCICYLIQKRLGQKIGLSAEQVLSFWVYGALSAIIGARALHVAVNWPSYAGSPRTALAFWDGGMVYVGGVTAALAAWVLYARKERLGLAAFDVLVLGIALTQGLGRIGCFFAGCCYGRPTSLPWGVHFGPGSIAHYTMYASGALEAGVETTPSLHPTQLYEAAASFSAGFLLLAWYRRKPAPGLIVCGYFALYSVVRFLIELLRNDPDRQFLFRLPESDPLILSTSQTAGIVLAIAAILVARRLQRRQLALATPVVHAPEDTRPAWSG